MNSDIIKDSEVEYNWIILIYTKKYERKIDFERNFYWHKETESDR